MEFIETLALKLSYRSIVRKSMQEHTHLNIYVTFTQTSLLQYRTSLLDDTILQLYE